jgi:hypothetical protein
MHKSMKHNLKGNEVLKTNQQLILEAFIGNT